MPVSEARLRANQQNSLRSTGPKTAEGKALSRANGLKHGATGSGVVIPEWDRDEVERRTEALQTELAPKSSLGQILVLQMATLSVRMERLAKQENSSVKSRARHAAENFDEARIDEAEWLIDQIAEDPRRHVRQLRKTPEGVNLLIQAWRGLRIDLTQDSRPRWTAAHLELAENLMGYKLNGEPGLRLRRLADAVYGKFDHLDEKDGVGLEPDDRKAWAKARLAERIDSEIADLKAHLETIDREMIALDRAEAADRALFDPSKEATLARRYEAEARRGFFKALDQFRQAEAEHAEPLASSCEETLDEPEAESESPEITRTTPRWAVEKPVESRENVRMTAGSTSNGAS